jgi:hypothetical protein
MPTPTRGGRPGAAEISACHDTIQLQFDFETEAERQNSLHKLDTLIAALRVFRAGIEPSRPSTSAGSGSSSSRRASEP